MTETGARRRGGQPGNSNRLKHGRYTRPDPREVQHRMDPALALCKLVDAYRVQRRDLAARGWAFESTLGMEMALAVHLVSTARETLNCADPAPNSHPDRAGRLRKKMQDE